ALLVILQDDGSAGRVVPNGRRIVRGSSRTADGDPGHQNDEWCCDPTSRSHDRLLQGRRAPSAHSRGSPPLLARARRLFSRRLPVPCDVLTSKPRVTPTAKEKA